VSADRIMLIHVMQQKATLILLFPENVLCGKTSLRLPDSANKFRTVRTLVARPTRYTADGVYRCYTHSVCRPFWLSPTRLVIVIVSLVQSTRLAVGNLLLSITRSRMSVVRKSIHSQDVITMRHESDKVATRLQYKQQHTIRVHK